MKRLAELRKEKNLSQLELGVILGIAQNLISHYECGRRNPSIPTIKKLATYFNVSIDYLVGLSDERGKDEA